ncbi:HK97 family phage prohead protease [Sandarakinorhabdus sp.]|uniref:HK97 family phage prohead protease n=1 Tax=Sandarakinorhabdus sp. TaxID=1916663 RepID=UPI003F7164D1
MNSLRVAGYASVFDVADRGGDVVAPGAFAGAAAPLPLLWQHKPEEPIGFVEALAEDGRGLRVTARIVAQGRGAEAAALVKAGAITGLSFGYRVKAASPARTGRRLERLELVEVSLVTFPMQREARVLGWQEENEDAGTEIRESVRSV